MTEIYGPLDGVKVIELGSWVAVPGAAAILGDWGAQVIKVENTRGGDPSRGLQRIENFDLTDLNIFFCMANRNKRGIALDLKQDKGREVLYRLLENADVFLTSLPQKSIKKQGLDHQDLMKLEP